MQETYTEYRDVTDAAGNNFTCEYSLVYDSSSAKVYRQQSGVACLCVCVVVDFFVFCLFSLLFL